MNSVAATIAPMIAQVRPAIAMPLPPLPRAACRRPNTLNTTPSTINGMSNSVRKDRINARMPSTRPAMALPLLVRGRGYRPDRGAVGKDSNWLGSGGPKRYGSNGCSSGGGGADHGRCGGPDDGADQ